MTFTPDSSKWTHDLYECATQSHLTRKLRQLVFERSGLTRPGRLGGPSTTSSLLNADAEVIVRMPSDPDQYYLKPAQMDSGHRKVEASRLLEDAPGHGDAQQGQEDATTTEDGMYLFHPPSDDGSGQLVKRDGQISTKSF
ncbi:hypothetical protein V865_006536 [Kwoniella europaea PYCC6329]|uniref:Uncharacterized protein n=1 Tax=Kwoniella europaea PYCC6329 TaxID=1423913 RepID=A0AAX4KR44_9TREE